MTDLRTGQGLSLRIGSSGGGLRDIESMDRQMYLERARNITRQSKVITEEDLMRKLWIRTVQNKRNGRTRLETAALKSTRRVSVNG